MARCARSRTAARGKRRLRDDKTTRRRDDGTTRRRDYETTDREITDYRTKDQVIQNSENFGLRSAFLVRSCIIARARNSRAIHARPWRRRTKRPDGGPAHAR